MGLSKHDQLFLLAKEKAQAERMGDLGLAAPTYPFAPEINPKSSEILAHSALPKNFMKRQRAASAMSAKKMKTAAAMYGSPFAPTLVANYGKKIRVS